MAVEEKSFGKDAALQCRRFGAVTQRATRRRFWEETVIVYVAYLAFFLVGAYELVTLPRAWRRERDLSPPPTWPFSAAAYSWVQRTQLPSALFNIAFAIGETYLVAWDGPKVVSLIAGGVLLLTGSLNLAVGLFNRPTFMVPPPLRKYGATLSRNGNPRPSAHDSP